MRRSIFFAVFFAASTIVGACTPGAATGLTGKDWQLTAITEKVPAFQGVIPQADQSRYTITFGTDLTFHGKADCNEIAGTYKTPGSNGLTIDVGASTLAFCPEDSLADLYVHALTRARTWAIANDTLTITLSDEGTLAFAAAAAPAGSAAATAAGTTTAATASAAAASTKASTPATAKPTPKPTAKPTSNPTAKPAATPTKAPGATPAPSAGTGLVGKAWQLTAITEAVPPFQGVVPAAQQPNYTITFAAAGTFSAKADCNTVSGTFTTPDPNAASGSLAIVPGPTTTAACPDGSLSDLYVIGLADAASYAIASGQLTITLQDGGNLVFK
ncbi:MAG: META domain-containing protein [Chloroflexota bacterium]